MKFQIREECYKELLEQIRIYFEASKISVHKARNEIKVISYNNAFVVAKSFKIPNIFNKIVYTFFRDSKAKKSYDNSIRIMDFVPEPVGYIEFEKFGFIYDSYFVSEKFEYDFTIREPLLEKTFEDKENIFNQFAEFTYKLHQNDIVHLDYSPGNILIKKDADNYIFKIVDINRMQFKKLSLEERLQSFDKLWAKDEDMKIIACKYAKLINEDENYCAEQAIKYSQKNKNLKNLKKRLKGKKVVD